VSKAAEVTFEITRLVRDTCLCLHLQRAARALARRFDQALRPLGLTSGQYSTLMSLNRPEPPSIGAVASLLAMDRTTLTANLKPLQREGLVANDIDPGDRRGRLVVLTSKGKRRLKAALPIWKRTHEEADALLVPVKDQSLRAGLRALAEGY